MKVRQEGVWEVGDKEEMRGEENIQPHLRFGVVAAYLLAESREGGYLCMGGMFERVWRRKKRQ